MGTFANYLFLKIQGPDEETSKHLQALLEDTGTAGDLKEAVKEGGWLFLDCPAAADLSDAGKEICHEMHFPVLTLSIFDSDAALLSLYDDQGEAWIVRGDTVTYELPARSKNLKHLEPYLAPGNTMHDVKNALACKSPFAEEGPYRVLRLMGLQPGLADQGHELEKREEKKSHFLDSVLASKRRHADKYIAALNTHKHYKKSTTLCFGEMEYRIFSASLMREEGNEAQDCLLVTTAFYNTGDAAMRPFSTMDTDFYLAADEKPCRPFTRLPILTPEGFVTRFPGISLAPHRLLLRAAAFLVPKEAARFSFYFKKSEINGTVNGAVIDFSRAELDEEPFQGLLPLACPAPSSFQPRFARIHCWYYSLEMVDWKRTDTRLLLYFLITPDTPSKKHAEVPFVLSTNSAGDFIVYSDALELAMDPSYKEPEFQNFWKTYVIDASQKPILVMPFFLNPRLPEPESYLLTWRDPVPRPEANPNHAPLYWKDSDR